MDFRQNRICIDVSQILANYRLLKKTVAEQTKLLAVIKADAYGHGLLPVAKALESIHCDGFCVAILEEAIALRSNGIQSPIFILGLLSKKSLEKAIVEDCIVSIADLLTLHTLIDFSKRLHRKAKIQIAINTGMNRIGLQSREEFLSIFNCCQTNAEYVEIVCAFTHFAFADENPDREDYTSDFSKIQVERFLSITEGTNLARSVSNSAGLLRTREAHFEFVRAGIVLYGYPPVNTNIPVKPCLCWESEITFLSTVFKGESIGYGRSFLAEKDMRIAVVAVGYGDGYPRSLSNKAQVIIKSRLCNLVGKVCMDMIMVDVSDIENVEVGDRVILLGQDGDLQVSADNLAKLAGTISYEILLHPSKRVPKVYAKNP